MAEVRMSGEMGREAVIRAALRGDAALPPGALEDWPWEERPHESAPRPGFLVASGATGVGMLDFFPCEDCGLWMDSLSPHPHKRQQQQRKTHHRGGLVGLGRT